MRIVKNKKGQFIVIAVMMIAIMIISLGAIMYSTGTYYRSEQWEEYVTLVEHVRLNTIHLVQISLAEYTASDNNSALAANLNQWQNDLRKSYPGYGIVLAYDLVQGTHQAYGTNIQYSQGLATDWNKAVSHSAANTTLYLNVTSIGLAGYKFMATAFVRLAIIDVDISTNEITVTVSEEDGMPITDLKKGSFKVDGLTPVGVTSNYDPQHILVYTIKCENLPSSSVIVTVTDHRGIEVIAKN
ncbi:MAG: hypothetical protein JSW05_03855 [Candidatus Thorarchaeota archaeon]|nr:MAG: hypothetical protein JSW05_03855 [Candidatus Thorarchaeota archaeon]